jgi:hypothetical protein
MAAAAALRPQGLKASLRSMTAWRNRGGRCCAVSAAGAIQLRRNRQHIKWQRLQHELVFTPVTLTKCLAKNFVNRLGVRHAAGYKKLVDGQAPLAAPPPTERRQRPSMKP